VNPKTLDAFVRGSFEARAKIAVLGMIHPQPTGYGRLICDKSGGLEKIVEEKNATPGERLIKLCNTGVIFAEKEFLFSCLAQVSPNELSKEYYLTDCFEIARRLGESVYVHQTEDYHEFDGVNDPEQLRKLSEWLRSEGRI
jgi:bifunctional UDP-N-acetylglucosamine pyrophosphorylase/glucosamine-1-phosphate N-acetyltransferase